MIEFDNNDIVQGAIVSYVVGYVIKTLYLCKSLIKFTKRNFKNPFCDLKIFTELLEERQQTYFTIEIIGTTVLFFLQSSAKQPEAPVEAEL